MKRIRPIVPTLMLLAAMLAPAGCRSGGDGPAPGVAPGAGAVPEAPWRGRWGRYDRPGYVTFVGDAELWVFEAGSDAAARFEREGPPRRSVTLVGVGPHRMNVRSVSRETIEGYLAADRR